MPEYRARRNVFERERWYLLDQPGLRLRETGKAERLIPYHSIRGLCLVHAPTRYIRDRYRCRIRLANGGRLLLSNQHYLGLGRFEDRGPEYAEFVRALHRRLQGHKAVFEQGVGRFAYWAMWGLGSSVGLLLGIFLLVGALDGDFLLVFGALAGFLPLGSLVYLFLIRNRPRPYRPDAIPPELLPADN
jgi:hypothetical protein